MTQISAKRLARVKAMEREITNAIGDAELEWAEVVSTLGFIMATLLDMQGDRETREAMGELLATRLVHAARVPGSLGVEAVQ